MSDVDTTVEDVDGDEEEYEDEGAEVEEDAEEEGEEEGDYDPDAEYTAEDVAKIIAENQKVRAELKRNRERYKRYEPIDRVFAGVTDSDLQAIGGFARTIAGGDRVAAVTWLAENAVGMAGDDDALRAQLEAAGFSKKDIAEGVKQADVAETAVDPAGPDVAALVKQLVAQEMETVNEQRARQDAERADMDAYLSELDTVLGELDYEPGSREAIALIQEATRMKTAGEAPDDIGEMMRLADRNLEKLSRQIAGRKAAKRKAAANGRPGPDGPAPAATRTGLTEREQSDLRQRNIQAKLEKDTYR